MLKSPPWKYERTRAHLGLRAAVSATVAGFVFLLFAQGDSARADSGANYSETFVAPVRYDYGRGEHRRDYTPRVLSRLEFSTKGNQSALALRVGQSWRVILNGRISRPHDYLGLKTPGTPAYRPPYWPWLVFAAGRAAYCAQIEGKWYVVVEGRESRAYDGVDCDSIRFAPDGRGPAFFARRAGRSFLVLEGREFPGYDNAHDFRFSQDGRHFVYFARRGLKTLVIYDGRVVGEYAGVKSVRSITRDGHIAYVLRTLRRKRGTFLDSKARVFKNAAEIATFEHVETPVLSPSGDLAFFARKWGRRMGMLARGREVNAWNHKQGYASDIRFSPGGRHMAYRVVWDAGFETMMISGSRVTRFASVAYPAGKGVFAAGNGRSIYIARKGLKSFVVVDGKPGKLHDEIRNSPRWGYPTFNNKGLSYAYQARLGDKWLVVVDGRAGGLYQEVSAVRFNPRGTGFAYSAKARDKFHLVLNGRRGPAYDSVISCGYDQKGDYRYAARKGARSFIVRNEAIRSLEYIMRGCPRGEPGGVRAHIAAAKKPNGEPREFIVVESKGATRKIQGPRDRDLKSGRGPAVYFERVEFLKMRNERLYFVARAGAKRYLGFAGRLSGPYDEVLSRKIFFNSRGEFHALALKEGKLFVIRGKAAD